MATTVSTQRGPVRLWAGDGERQAPEAPGGPDDGLRAGWQRGGAGPGRERPRAPGGGGPSHPQWVPWTGEAACTLSGSP